MSRNYYHRTLGQRLDALNRRQGRGFLVLVEAARRQRRNRRRNPDASPSLRYEAGVDHQMTEDAPLQSAAFDFDHIRKELVRKLGSSETVQVLIDQKMKELNGFIDEQGALLLIANLQGIDTTAPSEPVEDPASLALTTLKACEALDEGSYVNLKGAIVTMGDVQTAKNGNEYRVTTFSDATDQATLMLWGSAAHDNADLTGKPIILESVRLRTYEDRLQLRLTKRSHIHRRQEVP